MLVGSGKPIYSVRFKLLSIYASEMIPWFSQEMEEVGSF